MEAGEIDWILNADNVPKPTYGATSISRKACLNLCLDCQEFIAYSQNHGGPSLQHLKIPFPYQRIRPGGSLYNFKASIRYTFT